MSRVDSLTRSGKGVVVFGEPERLAQVVVDLVDNTLATSPADGRFVLSGTKEAGHAVARVEDSGHGIEKIDHQRLYRPAVLEHPFREKAGRGLFPAIRIMTSHRGDIRCGPAEWRKSARFTIPTLLPAP